MKIKTEQHYRIEWTAIDAENYDYDSYVGIGSTEQEAIQDLMDKLDTDKALKQIGL